MTTMSVRNLYEACMDLMAEGKGGWPVKIQIVDGGVTYSKDFGFSQGDPAEGQLVWIWPICEIELPK